MSLLIKNARRIKIGNELESVDVMIENGRISDIGSPGPSARFSTRKAL
jgi:dihydroorotase-like cyclic amidohydrolase